MTGFPKNEKSLKLWKDHLILTAIEDKELKSKKLCVKHFDVKFHNILLSPDMRRGPYVHPIDYRNGAAPSQVSSRQTNKIPTNYELLLQMKNDEIFELRHKIRQYQNENNKLKNELKKRESITYATDQIMKAEQVTPVAKTLIDMLFNKKSHTYTANEKAFCQQFHGKFPGAYRYMNNVLGKVLPCRRTLIRWKKVPKAMPLEIYVKSEPI